METNMKLAWNSGQWFTLIKRLFTLFGNLRKKK